RPVASHPLLRGADRGVRRRDGLVWLFDRPRVVRDGRRLRGWVRVAGAPADGRDVEDGPLDAGPSGVDAGVEDRPAVGPRRHLRVGTDRAPRDRAAMGSTVPVGT